MSPPRRRSSRLRGSNATPKLSNHASNRLASLTERDETPKSGAQPNLDALVSSPLAPRTPATALRPKPSREEMHPSKAHQSTAKEPDSGLRLGFTDIETKGGKQTSGVTQNTPSKAGISSSFDFRFARPAPQLGPEAQRMMNELREEAMRIKKKLAAEKEEQKSQAGEDSTDMNGRKIAQPKGKVGRFSDVHMAEFKKMDSIAGHPSSYRAQPNRFAPTTTSLKRTQSKAKLDESAEEPVQTERLENTAPAKRARKDIGDDASSARPVSRDNATKPTTPNTTRSHSTFLATITTPTQASLARSTSIKQSGSQNSYVVKVSIKAEPKKHSSSPGKFARVRSILRRVSPSPKKQTVAPSSIPSLLRSPSKPDFNQVLPSVPTTPINTSSKNVKHVNFTPDTKTQHVAAISNSPSPMKSGIPLSTSKINFGIKAPQSSKSKSNVDKVQYPSIASHPNVSNRSHEVEYPSLAATRPLPKVPRSEDARPPPYVPGTFTFRADSTINFGSSPKGFGSSPGQASVRPVRQSIIPNKMPGSFPGSDKENTGPIPSVPHGMSNKKRRRAESDDETEDEAQRSPKKHKAQVAEGEMLMAPRLMATPKSRVSSPAKKGVLSMSRLNMLALPKLRK
ncbi:hypothetical protein G7Y89_g15469 [Cudoniella acicularis]|uniref:Erythromycin esterase n=1 Tax=Cudoniella acicularis TaxID=354080 RepID=A0A8H4QLZ6_9HELO|nr:hypothetical protein G7Y89_g15469 [Cudoniella acicularis]